MHIIRKYVPCINPHMTCYVRAYATFCLNLKHFEEQWSKKVSGSISMFVLFFLKHSLMYLILRNSLLVIVVSNAHLFNSINVLSIIDEKHLIKIRLQILNYVFT